MKRKIGMLVFCIFNNTDIGCSAACCGFLRAAKISEILLLGIPAWYYPWDMGIEILVRVSDCSFCNSRSYWDICTTHVSVVTKLQQNMNMNNRSQIEPTSSKIDCKGIRNPQFQGSYANQLDKIVVNI